MEILIILLLIVLNGIFSMSEMALVSVRKFKLENAKKKGSEGAKVALDLAENPSKFLSTVQMGITLIGIMLGVYSGENLTNDIAELLEKISPIKAYAHSLAVGIIVVIITFFSIVLGELFPKRLGLTFPESISIAFSRPMLILSYVTAPFVWLLSATNNMLLGVFGIKKASESKITEEEIKSIIKESAEGGEIQDIEQNIVERVFELGDRKVNTLLTHRTELVYFNVDDSWEIIKQKINDEKHSAYPVCEQNNLDKIIGIVLLKDLFSSNIDSVFKVTDHIKIPLFLNENIYAYNVLELFKKEKMHYGIVIDEYGVTQGIVTMDDVVDALVGDVTEVDQDEYQITQRDANSWLIDGQYSVIDFLKQFDLNIDHEEELKYTTLAGMIIHHSKTLPHIGSKIIIDNFEFEIVDKDGQRIDQVLMRKLD